LERSTDSTEEKQSSTAPVTVLDSQMRHFKNSLTPRVFSSLVEEEEEEEEEDVEEEEVGRETTK